MYGVTDGISTVFEGDCEVVNLWSLGLHLLINTINTLLLSASGYTTPVLNALKDLKCDQAHARVDCLDVGITIFGNKERLDRGITSVPTHLLYKSAAFETIAINSNSR